MSKISKQGYEQIKVIKNALNSMYDKLNNNFYTKDISDEIKQTEKKLLQEDKKNVKDK